MGSIFGSNLEDNKEGPKITCISYTEQGKMGFHRPGKSLHQVRVFFGSVSDLEKLTQEEYVPSDKESLGLVRAHFHEHPPFMALFSDMAYKAYEKYAENVDVVCVPASVNSSNNGWYAIGYALKKK